MSQDLSQLRICLQCRKPRFGHWVGKIPRRREWLPTPVFLSGEFHRQKSLVGHSPRGCKVLDTTERLAYTHTHYSEQLAEYKKFSSVAQSCPALCDLRTAAPQVSLSSPIPRAGLNLCPLSQWCHPTISSSIVPFSSRLLSSPASGSFSIRHFFPSGGPSNGASASASVLPMNIQRWFALRWTGWISLQSKELSRVFSNTTVQKHQFFSAQLSW